MYTPFYWQKWKLEDLQVIVSNLRKNNNNPKLILKMRLKRSDNSGKGNDYIRKTFV